MSLKVPELRSGKYIDFEGEEAGSLGNGVTAIGWRSVGNPNHQRELWRVLLGVTAEECGTTIETETVKVGQVIGNGWKLLGDGSGDILSTVASCKDRSASVGARSVLQTRSRSTMKRTSANHSHPRHLHQWRR